MPYDSPQPALSLPLRLAFLAQKICLPLFFVAVLCLFWLPIDPNRAMEINSALSRIAGSSLLVIFVTGTYIGVCDAKARLQQGSKPSADRTVE